MRNSQRRKSSGSLQSQQMHFSADLHCAMRPRKKCLKKQKYVAGDDDVHQDEWFDELPELVSSEVEEHENEVDGEDKGTALDNACTASAQFWRRSRLKRIFIW